MADIRRFSKEEIGGIAKENSIFTFAKDLYEEKTHEEDNFKKAVATTCGIDVSKYRNGNVRLQDLDPVQKHNFFGLMAVTIDSIVATTLETQLDFMTEIQTVGWGDKINFEVETPYLPSVTKLGKGTTVMTSDILHTDNISLDTEARGVSIKESGFNILSGRVNWSNRINSVQKAMFTQMKADVNTALVGTLAGLGANYKVDGSAFNPQTFLTLANHVKAGSHSDTASAFGTQIGLSSILQASANLQGYMSESMKEQFNAKGFLGNFLGTDLMELAQAHVPNTDNFALDDKFIYILPASDQKIVKLGIEGDAIIRESSNVFEADDMSVNYKFIKQYGIAVVAKGKYGIYRLS